MENKTEQKKLNNLFGFDEVSGFMESKLKELRPMMDKANALLSQMPNLTPTEIKKVKIGKVECSVSINVNGIVFLDFKDKKEAEKFFKKLK